MPIYFFRDKTTGEVREEMISMSQREEVLKDPNIEQIITAPALISGVVGISMKNDDGFKEVLSKAAEAHPSSPLADKVLTKGIKETKTKQVIKKHLGI